MQSDMTIPVYNLCLSIWLSKIKKNIYAQCRQLVTGFLANQCFKKQDLSNPRSCSLVVLAETLFSVKPVQKTWRQKTFNNTNPSSHRIQSDFTRPPDTLVAIDVIFECSLTNKNPIKKNFCPNKIRFSPIVIEDIHKHKQKVSGRFVGGTPYYRLQSGRPIISLYSEVNCLVQPAEHDTFMKPL